MDIDTFLHEMPKVELHVHLEGCLSPELARTFAERNNIPLPESIVNSSTSEGYAFHDLASFLNVYYPALDVLRTEQDFYDLAWDYLTKAHKQNVRHVELFFDPQAHTTRSIPISTILNGYHSACQTALSTLSLSASLILCILRDHSAPSALSTLKSFHPYRHQIAGLGLDSNEHNNPPSKFTECYDLAREWGWNLTCHADIDIPNTITHITEALHVLKVNRLDHGTNILSSPDLTSYIKTNGIGLTCCPISNSIVSPTAKFPEILRLLRMGVKVTINSDDPAYFRGYMEENLAMMSRKTDVTREELVRVVRNGIEISWIEEEEREVLMGELKGFCKKAGVNWVD